MADPTMQDLQVGITVSGERVEFDSMGEVPVPAERWVCAPQ